MTGLRPFCFKRSEALLHFSNRAYLKKKRGSGEKQTKANRLCTNGLGLAWPARKTYWKMLLKIGDAVAS